MSSGPGSFAKANNLSELTVPFVGSSGVETAASRQAEAVANLGITASIAEINALEGAEFVAADLTKLGDVTADAAELNIMDGVTATAAEINVAADGSANTVAVAAGGAAVTPLAGGGTYLIPLVTANVTMTLPATPTLGEKHKLVFIGTAADAEDWVITAAAFFKGGVAFFDVGGTTAAVYANGTTENTMTVNNPAAGTEITFIGDGTNWTVTGMVSSADAPAFTAV